MSTRRNRTDLSATPPAGLKLNLPETTYELATFYLGHCADSLGALATSEKQKRKVQAAVERALDELVEAGVEVGVVAVAE